MANSRISKFKKYAKEEVKLLNYSSLKIYQHVNCFRGQGSPTHGFSPKHQRSKENAWEWQERLSEHFYRAVIGFSFFNSFSTAILLKLLESFVDKIFSAKKTIKLSVGFYLEEKAERGLGVVTSMRRKGQ